MNWYKTIRLQSVSNMKKSAMSSEQLDHVAKMLDIKVPSNIDKDQYYKYILEKAVKILKDYPDLINRIQL